MICTANTAGWAEVPDFCLWKTTETVLLHDPWKDSVMLKGQTHVIFRASENLRTRKIVSWVPMLVSRITSQNMTGSLFQTSHLFPCYLQFFDGPDGFPYPSDGSFHNTRIGPAPHPHTCPVRQEKLEAIAAHLEALGGCWSLVLDLLNNEGLP